MAIRKVSWVLPTTYTDGTSTDQGKIITHIFVDGVEVGASDPGATEWQGEVAGAEGATLRFSAACEMDGVADDMGPFSPEVIYNVPFRRVSPPTGLTIS